MYVVLKNKLPSAEHQKDNVKEADPNAFCTLHGTRTIKLGFVDDSTLFNKSHVDHSRNLSFCICSFQHVRQLKPSEIEEEFHYISRHVVELLSFCHPKLLIKWCENLMASETVKIKLFHKYRLNKMRQLKTSSSILKMMSAFWCWSNHSILTRLAELSEIAVGLLKDFDSRLCDVCSPITEYPVLPPASSVIPYNLYSYTLLTVKCNNKFQLSLKLVFDIQSLIIEKCEITQHALQLLAAQNSPPLLQWMIPKCIVSLININVSRHQQYLATKGITEILIRPNIKHCITGDVKTEILTQYQVICMNENISSAICTYTHVHTYICISIIIITTAGFS